VDVEDNQNVQAGDPLVEIDPKDYQVAVTRAQANLETSLASARALKTDGTGNIKDCFLHFELQGCGSNFPIVPTNAQIVVQTVFDRLSAADHGAYLSHERQRGRVPIGARLLFVELINPSSSDLAVPGGVRRAHKRILEAIPLCGAGRESFEPDPNVDILIRDLPFSPNAIFY
jgi:hypothetical protein